VSPIAAFKERHRIDDVVSEIVDLTERAGGRYLTGRCPFHDDRTPSLAVWPAIGKFRC